MTRTKRWIDSPSYNWVASCISAVMVALYVEEFLGPEKRPTTGFVLFVWAVMLGLWLTTAVYKTWFRDRKKR